MTDPDRSERDIYRSLDRIERRVVELEREELRAKVERYERALGRGLRGCPRVRHGMARCSETAYMAERDDWRMDCIARRSVAVPLCRSATS